MLQDQLTCLQLQLIWSLKRDPLSEALWTMPKQCINKIHREKQGLSELLLFHSLDNYRALIRDLSSNLVLPYRVVVLASVEQLSLCSDCCTPQGITETETHQRSGLKTYSGDQLAFQSFFLAAILFTPSYKEVWSLSIQYRSHQGLSWFCRS